MICDTPADPNLSCSSGDTVIINNCQYTGRCRDANGSPYEPDVSNIMSYAGDCRNSFTLKQYARISFYQKQYRAYLTGASCNEEYLTFGGVNSDGIFPLLSCNSGNITVALMSNMSWDLTSNQPWLKLSPSSGTNNAQIILSWDANFAFNDRYALITVSNNSSINFDVLVIQSENICSPRVSIYPKNITLPAQGSIMEGSTSITSNTVFNLEFAPYDSYANHWLELPNPIGGGSAGIINTNSFNFIAKKANTTFINRYATIYVNYGNGQRDSFTVTQPAKGAGFLDIVPYLSSLGNGRYIGPLFDIRSDLDWEIQSNKTWFKFLTNNPTIPYLQRTNGSGFLNGLGVEIDANTSGVDRQANITLSAKDTIDMINGEFQTREIKRTINIIQFRSEATEAIPNHYLNLIPNPANDMLTLSFSLSKREARLNITLYDLKGRVIKTLAEGGFRAGEHQLEVDVSDLASGVYMLSLLNSDKRLVEKLIIK